MVAVYKPELQEDCVVAMVDAGPAWAVDDEDNTYVKLRAYDALADMLDGYEQDNQAAGDEIYDLNIVINDLRNELGEAYRRLAEAENQRDEYYARISS